MELQPRDLAILELVGELGTADTDILKERYFPDVTLRRCQQRLQILTEEGLLKAVQLNVVDQDKMGGSVPTLYFLTDAGAELLENETGIRPRRVTRSDPKPHTLRHRMDTVRARLAIDQAASLADIPKPDWIMEQDARGRAKGARGRSPTENRILKNSYDRDGRIFSFRPDASCHLRIPRPSGEGHKSLVAYLEVDRSTEGHLQWQRKLWGIEAFLRDPPACRGHWPGADDPVAIVLVLCKSEQRIGNLIETTSTSTAAVRIRFTRHPLDPQTVLTGDVWQGCQGELKRIISGK